MTDRRRWGKDERVAHRIDGLAGTVLALDFAEELAQVDYSHHGIQDVRWSRLENLDQVILAVQP